MPLCRPRSLAGPRPLVFAVMVISSSAQAFEFDTGNPDFKLRWDNTLKYSVISRLKDRSSALSKTDIGPQGIVGPNNLNQDDGDNNFGKGIVSNRVDVLSELDLSVQNFGARISAAGWYDTVYNEDTDNPGLTSNHTPASHFPSETRKVMGRKVELLDAFVFGKSEVFEKPVTARLGRHTLLWGESLFFGNNGIAGGQAPLDLVKLLSVPNSQFKEVALPTGKLSAQIQLSNDVAVGAYIGYEWDKTQLIPVGSFLSTSDSLGPGNETIKAGPLGVFSGSSDLEPRNSGQGGVQVRWRANGIDTDFGLYAIRYHATTPSNIWTTLNGPPSALTAGSYRWVYHEGIRAYGASFAKTIDEWSFAGEASYRQNTPLASSGQVVIPSIGVGSGFDNRHNPGYAVGESAHLQLSWIASLGPSFIANEASFLGEVAWNTRTKVTENPQMLNPNADKSATALRMVYSPSYRQILPGWDMTPSIGLGYGWGRSSAVGPGFAVNRGGDVNFGVSAVYLDTWRASVNYVHYLGSEGSTVDNNNDAQFKQALKDRDFLSFSLRTTF